MGVLDRLIESAIWLFWRCSKVRIAFSITLNSETFCSFFHEYQVMAGANVYLGYESFISSLNEISYCLKPSERPLLSEVVLQDTLCSEVTRNLKFFIR